MHSPAVASELYGTLVQMKPLSRTPDQLENATQFDVQLSLWGRVPLGKQRIFVTDEVRETPGGTVRTLHDTGGALSGPLSLVKGWHHRMTITAAANQQQHTHWHDSLSFSGPIAALAWPALFLTWHWRARRLKRIAASWSDQP